MTGHAEVIDITFDPAIISATKELLEVFFKTHDPTTLNRQGADTGTQYRSVIYYHSEEQHTASRAVEEASSTIGQAFPNPIVTEITAAPEFYPAEDYHQNYLQPARPRALLPVCGQAPRWIKVKQLFGGKAAAAGCLNHGLKRICRITSDFVDDFFLKKGCPN